MILVTGGAGYLGSRLLPQLIAAGHNVRVVDALWFDSKPLQHPRLEVISADLASFNAEWLRDVDDIIHLAGLSNDVTAEFAPDLALRSNVQATSALASAAAAEAAKRQRPIRCIFASSCSVYHSPEHLGNGSPELLTEEHPVEPSAIYSQSKRAAEIELLKASDSEPFFCPVILRKGTIFGFSPRMRFDLVVNSFSLDAWSKRRLVLNGAGDVWRPLLHIDDAVEAYLALLKIPAERMKGRIYNLLGRNVRISDLAWEVATVLRQACCVGLDIVRHPTKDNGGRSYRVDGGKISADLGIHPNRDTRASVLDLWEKLQDHSFGKDPANDARYFNIRWLTRNSISGTTEVAGNPSRHNGKSSIENAGSAHEPKARRQIPYFRHGIGDEEIQAVSETLRSDWLTSGPRVKQFEADFSAFVGAPYAIAVASATAALRLALEAMGVGPGDDVLVPTMTFASAVAVVIHRGARPVFVDCTPDTLTMEPADLERKITSNSRVVMPMHYAGHPCDLDAVHEIAARHNLQVLEDAAHALTAAYRGKTIGSTSETSCFSFYANKTITTGEGGMVATFNADLAARMRLMAYHGINRDVPNSSGVKRWWSYEVVAPGFKDNMTDIQAAIGVEQLKKAHAFRNARQRCADLYREALNGVPGVRAPASCATVRHAWHLHVIQLQPEDLKISRDEFSLRLEEEGVANSVHYLPLHLHKYYRETFGCRPADCPAATAACDRIVSLPIFPGLADDDVAYVAEQIRKLCLQYRR